MTSALAIDTSYYFAQQNKLQTAADSSALAAAQELFWSTEIDASTRLADSRHSAQDYLASNEPDMQLASNDLQFGYIDPTRKVYDSSSFATTSSNQAYTQTAGYNAVKVNVIRKKGGTNTPLGTIMARMFGVATMDTAATSIAFLDSDVTSITNGGLRPIYACQAQFDHTLQDGNPDNNIVRIYGDHVEVDGIQNQTGCPAMGSGNWGFADLRNCSPDAVGSSTIGDWFTNGFPGTVNIGQCYSTNPGNFINSIEFQLNTLIANKTIFPIPMYNAWAGSGSNSQVTVTGFVGFQITGFKSTGSESARYIEGHFHKFVCTNGCSSNASVAAIPVNGSTTKIRLAALN